MGVHFKYWQTKTTMWLTAMNMFWVASGTPEGTITIGQENEFKEATIAFVRVVISMIREKLVDTYLDMQVAKNLWDALEANFGATGARSEIYVMEMVHDYRMAENRLVLNQANEI